MEINANLGDSSRGLALEMTPYLHMLRMHLAQAVALDEAVMGADGSGMGSARSAKTLCSVSTDSRPDSLCLRAIGYI